MPSYLGPAAHWDKRYLALCEHIAQWSKDPSTKTGVVIVDPFDNSIVSMGYNGLPREVKDTAERLTIRETKYKMIVHADINALLFARRAVRGFYMYTWPFPPCSRCAGAIIQAGITNVIAPEPSAEIIVRWGDDLKLSFQMFDEAGVACYLTSPEL